MAVRVAISAEKDLPSTGWQCGSYANSQKMPAPLMDGYDLYYRSGVYERRYPAPNPATLQLVLGLLDGDATRVLDFGCGSGRYAVPLAMKRPVRVLAYDPCEEGLSTAAPSCALDGCGASHRDPVGSLDALPHAWPGEGPVDLVIMLFGVLGHIRFRSERLRHLQTVRGLLRSGGRLVVSVPNAQRRFHREQASPGAGRACESPAMCSTRGIWEVGRWNCSTTCTGSASWRSSYRTRAIGRSRRAARACSPSGWSLALEPPRPSIASLRAVTPTRLAYGFLTVAANGKELIWR